MSAVTDALRANGSSQLRVAVPNKGSAERVGGRDPQRAGYRRRTDPKDPTVLDPVNNVEFFFLRPRTSRSTSAPVSWTSGSPAGTWRWSPTPWSPSASRWVSDRRRSGTPPPGRDWTVADLAGKRIASAYPNLVRKDLAANGIDATVIRLDGAVEISVQLGVADAIADVVGSGRTLRAHNLVAFGESLCDSEAVLIERAGNGPDAARDQLAARVQVWCSASST